MNEIPQLASVVMAGWNPGEEDPLAAYSGGGPKALIPIAGKPMVAYVVDAIAGSRYVNRVVIVGLDPEDGVAFATPVEYVPARGGMLDNAEAGIERVLALDPGVPAVLFSSSDIPTLTPAIVDAFIETCFETDHDLYYSIVEQSVMERRFPESRRSYVRLREGRFAGGDLILVRAGMALTNQELWQRLSAARKNAWRQASLFGLWPLLKLVLRRLSLPEAEARAGKALGCCGRAVVFPYAEVGMDVDKPFQLEIARAELELRAAA